MTPTPVGMRCPECAKQTTTVRSVRDEPSAWQKSPVTVSIIAINVAVFVLGLALDGGSGLMGGGIGELQRRGGLFAPLVANGEWWRIVTSGFLHFGIIHIAFNMFLVYMLGSQIEMALGGRRYVLVFGGALLAGSLGATLAQPLSLSAGASGAGFGLMGAYGVVAWARGINIQETGVLPLIVINLVITFTIPGISWGAHLGGLLGGALLAFLFAELDDRRNLFGKAKFAPEAIAVLFGIACFIGTNAAAHAAVQGLV
ncbi:MAG: rhomboid family intramembrane serine protease [Thermoleophilaceae bacterium]|nr:rhomboid family intramembrane serine protease [Thermoleophilaceae bacterium]